MLDASFADLGGEHRGKPVPPEPDVSWLMSIPRFAKRSSAFPSDSGYLTYIITTRRMTSGELLKYRNGLLMARALHDFENPPAFGLTLLGASLGARADHARPWGAHDASGLCETLYSPAEERRVGRVDDLRRGDQTDAFAGTGRRKAENMLGAIMAEIMVVQSAEQHAEP
jgi:hypothetical protein